MSRNQEFGQGQGRPEHRGQDYKSGGIGHVGDDRSVVGMVPTHKLLPFRDHTGDQHAGSGRVVGGIRSELQQGGHLNEPLMLMYDHKNKLGHLGEGNHRLQAAIEAGVSHVPVRVVKAGDLSGRPSGPLALHTNFDRGDYPYVPPDIHPAHFGL